MAGVHYVYNRCAHEQWRARSVRSGVMLREGDEQGAEMTHEGKIPMRELLELNHTPRSVSGDIMTILCEVLSNARKYSTGKTVHYHYRVEDRLCQITLLYITPEFDTNPPLPDPRELPQGGMGLGVIRALTDKCEFKWNGHMLKIVLTKRW